MKGVSRAGILVANDLKKIENPVCMRLGLLYRARVRHYLMVKELIKCSSISTVAPSCGLLLCVRRLDENLAT
jgi:hypothetical protein